MKGQSKREETKSERVRVGKRGRRVECQRESKNLRERVRKKGRERGKVMRK
jgi:hypothetical protein